MNHKEVLISAQRRLQWLPERYRRAIREIETLKPGLESENMQSALALLPGLFNGGMVILAGPIGSGKTFAACVLGVIVCNFCEGDDWIRLEGKFVQSHAILKAAFDNVDYATDPFLIVDDMGREHFTDKGFGISEWDRFFDARYADMMPTIVTTNLTETEFEEKYNRRILDRLKECAEWIVFSGQSLRGRGA